MTHKAKSFVVQSSNAGGQATRSKRLIEGISALKQFNQKKSNGPKAKKKRHNFKFGGGSDLLDV